MIPIHDLWWLAAGGSAGYGARYLRARIDAALTTRRRSRLPDHTGELLRLQTLYGYNPYSLASIARGALVWSAPDIDGCVIYRESGRVWLVSEKDNAERLHQALPKSNLIVLPKTGHEIPFTRSQAVVEEIERIQRLSG